MALYIYEKIMLKFYISKNIYFKIFKFNLKSFQIWQILVFEVFWRRNPQSSVEIRLRSWKWCKISDLEHRRYDCSFGSSIDIKFNIQIDIYSSGGAEQFGWQGNFQRWSILLIFFAFLIPIQKVKMTLSPQK